VQKWVSRRNVSRTEHELAQVRRQARQVHLKICGGRGVDHRRASFARALRPLHRGGVNRRALMGLEGLVDRALHRRLGVGLLGHAVAVAGLDADQRASTARHHVARQDRSVEGMPSGELGWFIGCSWPNALRMPVLGRRRGRCR
jgi:hypothetical protein